MAETEVDLSELVRTRELIAKKCGQSVKERAKREDKEECETFNTSPNHRDSQPSNDVVVKSCPIRMTSSPKQCVKSDEVERIRLPDTITNRKRYIIRSTKTNSIKVSTCKAPSPKQSSPSNKEDKMLESFDANKLTKRLQILLSARDDGTSSSLDYQEIDSILYKLREMQVIL